MVIPWLSVQVLSCFGSCAVLPFLVRTWNGLALADGIKSPSVFAMRSLGCSGRAQGSAALDFALAYTFVAFVYDAVVADVLGHAGCALPSASATVQELCADVAGCGARADIVGLARGQKCSPWHSVFLHRALRDVPNDVGCAVALARLAPLCLDF